MTIKEVNLKDLIPYEKNPRNNEKAVEAVANSIKEFGFRIPIVIDKDNVIVAGHTRMKAAEQLGIKKVPCIVADDLTPEQIKAFRLVDNRTAELADWDFDLLENELNELSDLGISMNQFGFDLGTEIDDDVIQNYFEDSEANELKKAKTVICPHCGEELIKKCDYILESFFSIKQWQIPICKAAKGFLLDSGAFSFMNGRKATNIEKYAEDYANFVKEYDIQNYFELDVESIVGWDSYLKINDQIEKITKMPSIPVFHKRQIAEDVAEKIMYSNMRMYRNVFCRVGTEYCLSNAFDVVMAYNVRRNDSK